MKTKFFLVAVIAILFAGSVQTYAQTSGTDNKVLIVYYSLRNGNTRIVAEHIRQNVGGDLFRIETVDAYPSIYREVTDQAKKELESNYRPPLKSEVHNFDEYDTIYLGSPNWWNTIAPAVMTFLETHNFEGKTIIPFITHEGSRLGASVDDIKKLASKATVLKGLPVRGSSVDSATSDIQKWLKELNIIK